MGKLRVLYHDNCFDGLASAAVFSSFYRACISRDAEIEYEGLTHKAGQHMSDDIFGPGANVIVDFKYSSSDKLTWWFDHHESAFLSADDESHFRAYTGGKKFHDPTFRSCTKFIASVARETFGFSSPSLEDLIHWADIIDGAQFPSAQFAVELKEAAMRLMLVIEGTRDRDLLHRIIQLMQQMTLAQVLHAPEVHRAFETLYDLHLKSIDIMRKRTTCSGGVIEFDVSDLGIDGQNKFIPYYLFPEGIYCVGVARSDVRSKVSVGTNPWSLHERIHNLAKLCEQYGGGGHAVVAAISFKPEDLDAARTAAHDIAAKLRNDLRAASGNRA
jgi:hypothetical protein